jgi:predicted tellurium resistance membrane protein TerC
MDLLLDPHAWIAFAMLTGLELVLGIDNVIFISILVDKLPRERRETARRLGLFLAMFMRVGLLLMLAWIIGWTAPLFALPWLDQPVSGRDLVLIAGGLFLVWKSTREIHEALEGSEHPANGAVRATFGAVILQIIVIDLVFSLDSIITAVGMVREVPVMIAAIVASVALMMAFARFIGQFISDHPTIKMLALAFLVVVGVVLIADGFHHSVPKGYVYAAMAFSVAVEMLNIWARKRNRISVRRRERYASGLEEVGH